MQHRRVYRRQFLLPSWSFFLNTSQKAHFSDSNNLQIIKFKSVTRRMSKTAILREKRKMLSNIAQNVILTSMSISNAQKPLKLGALVSTKKTKQVIISK